MEELAAEFEARLRDAVRECVKLAYHPRRFEEMLNGKGGVATAKQLIGSGDLQDGLRRIVKLNRPELSMEHIMLEPAFLALFTAGELDAARWRLDQAKRAE